MILSNFPRTVNHCYFCYQLRQQRRLTMMTSKRSKWNNSLGELSIIFHWEISVNHCWKCNNFEFLHSAVMISYQIVPLSTWISRGVLYEGVSINNQPIPFPMDRDGHDFHALFQCMFYTWVQNCTRIESFFNKILNVKHGYWCKGMLFI